MKFIKEYLIGLTICAFCSLILIISSVGVLAFGLLRGSELGCRFNTDIEDIINKNR